MVVVVVVVGNGGGSVRDLRCRLHSYTGPQANARFAFTYGSTPDASEHDYTFTAQDKEHF